MPWLWNSLREVSGGDYRSPAMYWFSWRIPWFIQWEGWTWFLLLHLNQNNYIIFLSFFFFEIILDLQKTCKLSRGSFYIPFSHVSLLSCNHSQFLGLSLFFVTFTVLRRACHMFCRMSFNWGFPIIRLKFWIWRRTQHRWSMLLIASFQGPICYREEQKSNYMLDLFLLLCLSCVAFVH